MWQSAQRLRGRRAGPVAQMPLTSARWSLLAEAVAWALVWRHCIPALELSTDAAHGDSAQALRTLIWRTIATIALLGALVLFARVAVSLTVFP